MSKIGNEYAEALFILARENNSEHEYAEALKLVFDVFEKNPEYVSLLSSPALTIAQRLALLDDAFSKVLPDNVLILLKLICQKRQMRHIQECALRFDELYNNLGQVSVAKVTSAVELSASQKEVLRTKLEKISGNTVMLDFDIKNDIIGGIVVEIDGKVMDLSIHQYLKDLKDVISG